MKCLCYRWPACIMSFSVVLAGCPMERGRTVRQAYVLQVDDAVSGDPVPNAVITAWPEERQYVDESDEEYLDRIQDEYQGTEAQSPTTNEDGQAELILRSGVFCAREQCTDPTYIDLVTRYVFLVRVETDVASEILSLRMVPGNSVSGELFIVTVVSIGEPR